MSKTLIPILVSCLLLAPTGAQAHTDLCSAARSTCEYSGQDAPILLADVCYERGASPSVYLKSTGSCPSGAFPYMVRHGEVINAVTGEVQAYIPLSDACAHPGVCQTSYAPIGTSTEGQALCCEYGICVPLIEVLCNNPDDLAVWCDDGVSNPDGTITCFDAEPL